MAHPASQDPRIARPTTGPEAGLRHANEPPAMAAEHNHQPETRGPGNQQPRQALSLPMQSATKQSAENQQLDAARTPQAMEGADRAIGESNSKNRSTHSDAPGF